MPRKERLITHDLEYIEYTCTQVRIFGKTAKLEEGVYVLSNRDRPRADALQELQEKNVVAAVKIISIKKQEKKRGFFGMTESDYLEYARPMETRTKFAESKEEKEIEDNEEDH